MRLGGHKPISDWRSSKEVISIAVTFGDPSSMLRLEVRLGALR
jgi:hypothetical protein